MRRWDIYGIGVSGNGWHCTCYSHARHSLYTVQRLFALGSFDLRPQDHPSIGNQHRILEFWLFVNCSLGVFDRFLNGKTPKWALMFQYPRLFDLIWHENDWPKYSNIDYRWYFLCLFCIETKAIISERYIEPFDVKDLRNIQEFVCLSY